MKPKIKQEPNYSQKETMYIIAAKCWNCTKPMNVAVIRGDDEKRGGSTAGPETFSKKELEIAKEHNVLIKSQDSYTMQDTYLANTCKECNAFIGRFYLFLDYYHEAEYGTYKYICFDLEDD